MAMCTSAAITVNAAIMGPGKAVTVTRLTRVPVVKMWSSLPETIDGDLVNENGALFSNTFLFLDELGGEDVTPFFSEFLLMM